MSKHKDRPAQAGLTQCKCPNLCAVLIYHQKHRFVNHICAKFPHFAQLNLRFPLPISVILICSDRAGTFTAGFRHSFPSPGNPAFHRGWKRFHRFAQFCITRKTAAQPRSMCLTGPVQKMEDSRNGCPSDGYVFRNGSGLRPGARRSRFPAALVFRSSRSRSGAPARR